MNPKSNAILERIHQVLADRLRVFDLENMDIDLNEEDPFDKYLQLVAYEIKVAYHLTHRHSPTQMVFSRDMFLPIDSQINWEPIAKRKQKRIHKSNKQENSKQIDYKYNTGDLIVIKKLILPKLRISKEGPFKVTQQNNNGTTHNRKTTFCSDKNEH